ncbi:MAG: TIGR03087 family PEP-CTERM/XrtA system glycosyltransferase [Planctomycetota bacterium]|nr:TIGR03087 family PEP-CTERM/XrtA system glycosyltransferase [Planctomycetota bacterium]
MQILFLAQRIPYPPNRGDKITSWRLIERMSRDHDVTVVAFAHDEGDRAAAKVLNEEKGIRTIAIDHDERKKKLTSMPLLLTGKPLTLGVYGSKALQSEVDKLIPNTDFAYAFSSSMGAFLLPHSLPWVMHIAELDSDKWRQYAKRSSFPMSWVYGRECKTLLRFEQRLAAAAITNVLCTPLEEDIFKEQIPGFSTTVLQNGVDLKFFHPAPEKAEPGRLVFTGVMDYLPNIDACVHFVEDILPLIREKHPDVRFDIVGSKPTPEVKALANTPGVTVTGFVDDIRDWSHKASIAVAPLRIARGIQNKVLEALSMGLPVVGSTSATQGVQGKPGEHYWVTDDPAEHARMVIDLLDHPDKAQELGLIGRKFVEDNYDWEVTLKPLDGIIEGVQARAK